MIWDETSVEIDEPEELSDVPDIFRGFPVGNSCYLDRVHRDRTIFQDNSQKFDFICFEDALVRFQVEIQFLQSCYVRAERSTRLE